MSQNSITLFMWGYQSHFRSQFERLLDLVMMELGIHKAGGKCLLVGAKMPGVQAHHDVCVEPEDGQWPLSLFANLPSSIEHTVKTHPLQKMFYGDAPSMRDKPENIRRDSVRRAVQDALAPYDTSENIRSFAGGPAPVDGYHVVPVFQLPEAIFGRYRPLREKSSDGREVGIPSLIHAAVKRVLSEAYGELLRPDPGRYLRSRSSSPDEIVRRAANDFMYTPGIAIGDKSDGSNLFERFNLISSLMYEGAEGKGRMLLANLESGAVDVALALAEPVPFREPRWSRKVLQMASSDTALLANSECILGLGDVTQGIDPWAMQNVFEVEFHDHYHWSLSCGNEVLLVSKYGVPALPQERFPKERLLDTFQRLFPEATTDDIASFTALFEVAAQQRHGSMLVVARDAREEATRLRGQGTKIEPTKLTPALYRRVSKIDGTVLVDPYCVCHAVGVILDGPANEECTPSRGSRYNSGIRYVAASTTPRLAVVVSDDGTVDVIPVLRPRVRRSILEEYVARLEASTIENYHAAISWLDKHRFYLDTSQCERINAAQQKLDKVPMRMGEMRVLREEFEPDPSCTPDYFEPETGV